MKKSISTCVWGVIFSLIGALGAYLFWIIFTLVAAFSDGALEAIRVFLPLLNLISFLFALIGSLLCLWRVKIGSIIMLIASIISLLCFLILAITLNLLSLRIIFFAFPSIVIFIASMKGLKKAKRSKQID